MYTSRGGASEYRNTRSAGVDSKQDPHRTITLLLEGAIERVRMADAAISQGDNVLKATSLTKAISIVDALRSSLDHQAGGEIAQGLDSMYEYMGHRLMQANSSGDRACTTEVTDLLGEIASAWASIPAQLAAQSAR